MVKILDCTIRDSGHCTNWNYSDEYIFNFMSDLKSKNINFFEIGYRNYYDRNNKGVFYYCKPDFLQKFYDKKGKLNLGIMVDTKRYNENDFINANMDYVDFIRIATHPEKIKETIHIAENLHARNYNVMIQLMDIKNLLSEHYDLLENWHNKEILETIYLADTYGTINTEELEVIYKKIKSIGYKYISFHAHNKKNLALSNSKKIIELGAYSIDVAQIGAGINGGNLQYDELRTVI